jgi:hypothetical protein
VNRVVSGSCSPGSTLTGLVYESAMDPDVFARLMAYAGFEG